MHELNCRNCGVAFYSALKRRYCSTECRKHHTTAGGKCVCTHCGDSFDSGSHKRKICDICRKTHVRGMCLISALPRSCMVCGNTFTPSNVLWDRATCSRKCTYRKPRRSGICAYCGSSFQYAQSREQKCCSRACRAKMSRTRIMPAPRELHISTCVLCGKLSSYCGPRRKRCSGCSKATRGSLAKAGLLLKKCRRCGSTFRPEPEGSGAWKRYCGPECDKIAKRDSEQRGRRISKARRRAIERGCEADKIDPHKVFDRDGWRCQICGIATPARLRGKPVDKAPELDHVVALANGGSHTYDNVQCACRKCNGMKGSGRAVGQIGLFGMGADKMSMTKSYVAPATHNSRARKME